MAELISMLAATAGQGGVADVDPNFNQTVLLLHGDGTNGAQNNTFLDSSSNGLTITRGGSTTQGTFSPFSAPDGGWSNFFEGSNFLQVTNNSALNISGDFTIEAWVCIINDSAPDNDGGRSAAIYSTNSNSAGTPNMYFYIGGSATTTGTAVAFRIYDGSTAQTVYFNTTLSKGIFYHVAICRSSGTVKMFLNGVSQTLQLSTLTHNLTSSSTRRIGRFLDSQYVWQLSGYISNLRHTNQALYTSDFTPSISGLTTTSQGASSGNVALLTCQSYRFVDNTASPKTVTTSGSPKVTPFSPFAPTAAYDVSVNGGSGYFGGTGNYLHVTDTSNLLAFGSSDFTVEAFVYLPDGSVGAAILTRRISAAVYGGYQVGVSSSGVTFLADDNTSAPWALDMNSPTQAIRLNSWNHVAVTRSGNTFTTWTNGVSSQTVTSSITINSTTTTAGINAQADGNGSGLIYISNLRVVTGQALYTGSTYTMPDAPLTTTGYGSTSQSITGSVALLVSMDNAGIFDNTGKNNLETVADAQIDTTTKKFGTGSMEFDGTGDYLVVNSGGQDLAFGLGAFTIEFWVYINTVKNNALVDFRPNGVSNGAYVTLYQESGGTIRLYVSGSDRITGGSLSIDTWYHIALTRSGTDTKLFIDGTQSGSTYTDSTVYLSASNRPLVGQVGDSPSDASFPLDGFIDDLRITKGVARYTTTFTPPTKAFPDL